MDNKNSKQKTPFLKSKWFVLILYISVFAITWESLYAYFNYVPNVKDKVCFKTMGLTFGCVPHVMQKGLFYEVGTEIDLNDEFSITEDAEAEFFIKENGKNKSIVSFSNEGSIPITLYVKYKNKVSKFAKTINIGDSIPPTLTQTSIPKIKLGEVIILSDYITVKDDRDPDAHLFLESIYPTEIGKFDIGVYACDKNNNISSINFVYEVEG